MIYDGSPFLAKQVSSKYSEMSAKKVRQDLSENHYRALSQDYIQNLSQKVGELIEEEERHIQYTLPAKVIDCQIVSIGRDGTTIYVREDGYRETMSGTISFYNVNRERIYTIYLAQAPQYGKECFNFRMERMINIVKSYLPINTTYIGLADGASDNWSFLDVHTKVSIIDYWHATEYLTLASSAASRSSYEKKKWLEQAREQLKNKKGAAKTILGEMKKFRNRKNLGKKVKDDLQKAITYFTQPYSSNVLCSLFRGWLSDWLRGNGSSM